MRRLHRWQWFRTIAMLLPGRAGRRLERTPPRRRPVLGMQALENREQPGSMLDMLLASTLIVDAAGPLPELAVESVAPNPVSATWTDPNWVWVPPPEEPPPVAFVEPEPPAAGPTARERYADEEWYDWGWFTGVYVSSGGGATPSALSGESESGGASSTPIVPTDGTAAPILALASDPLSPTNPTGPAIPGSSPTSASVQSAPASPSPGTEPAAETASPANADGSVLADTDSTLDGSLVAGSTSGVEEDCGCGDPEGRPSALSANSSVLPPTAAFKSGLRQDGTEAGTPMRFAVVRSGDVNGAWLMQPTFGGTATYGVDYVVSGLVDGAISFDCGQSTAFVYLIPIDDGVAEGVEDVTVDLGPSWGGDGPSQIPLFLYDDEPFPLPSGTAVWVEGVYGGVEYDYDYGNGSGQFTLKRSGNLSQSLTVNYTLGGDAEFGPDYVMAGGSSNTSVIFGIGQSTRTVGVQFVRDFKFETTESIELILQPGPGYQPSEPTSRPMWITDSDRGTVRVQATGSPAEGGAEATFTFTRVGMNGLQSDLVVKFSKGGTAKESDYLLSETESVTIPAGATQATVTLVALEDSDDEPSESVTLAILPDDAYARDQYNGSAIVYIADNDPPPTPPLPFVWIASRGGGTEGDDGDGYLLPAWMQLERNGDLSQPLTVNYSLGGEAKLGDDYAVRAGATSTSATFAAGQKYATVYFDVVDDQKFEPREYLSLELQADPNYRLWTRTSASTWIDDNDRALVRVTALGSATEGGGTATLKFERLYAVAMDDAIPISILLSDAKGDATLPGGTASIVIPAGEMFVLANVAAVDDSLAESTEYLTVNLVPTERYSIWSNGPYAPLPRSWASVSIVDNDTYATPPSGSVWVTSSVNGREGGTQPYFTLQRSGDISKAATVGFSLSGTAEVGTDYSVPASTVSFGANVATAKVTLTPLQDERYEGTETVVLSIVDGGGFTPATIGKNTLEIVDSDRPWVSMTPGSWTATEGGSTATITISRSLDGGDPEYYEPVGLALDDDLPVRLLWTGAGTSGLTLPDEVVIPAGKTSVEVTVAVPDDGLWKPTESLFFAILADERYERWWGPGYYNYTTKYSSSASILDNDGTTVSKPPAGVWVESADNLGTGEGDEPAYAFFRLKRSGGDISKALTVQIELAGTATYGTDYTMGLGHSKTQAYFGANSNMAYVAIVGLEDQTWDPGEKVELRILEASGYELHTPTTGSIELYDNDTPLLTLAATHPSEAGTVGKFTVSRPSGVGTADDLTVFFELGGTASKADYTASATGSVTIAAGQTSAYVTIAATDDAEVDPNETVTFKLLPSPSYGPSYATSTVWITDNDLPPPQPAAYVWLASATGTGEGAGSGTFVLERAGGDLTKALTANVSLSGTADLESDYAVVGQSVPASKFAVTFAANSKYATVELTPVDDSISEATEVAKLTVEKGSTYSPWLANAGPVTILDNDAAVVSVLAVDDAFEEGTVAGHFAFSRIGDLSSKLPISVQVGGEAKSIVDYLPFTGGLEFAAGAASFEVAVAPLADSKPEGLETVSVRVEDGSNYSAGERDYAYLSIFDAQTIGTLDKTDPTTCPPGSACAMNQPGKLVGSAAGANGYENPNNATVAPVRYADGVARIASVDLFSTTFGESWGLFRSYTNGGGYADEANDFGNNQVVTQAPRLVQDDEYPDRVWVVLNGTTAVGFARLPDDTYVVVGPRPHQLRHDTGTGTFVLTDSTGQVFTFHDFGVGQVSLRGRGTSIAHPGGGTTAYAYDGSGRLASIARSGTANGQAVVERIALTRHASGPNAGKVATATLARSVAAGAFVTAGSASYVYYDGVEAHGRLGDLKTATIFDAAGARVSTKYQRYYASGPFPGGLKYLVEGAQYDQYAAAVGTPFTASDSQLGTYANHYFEYDGAGRVVREIASGEGCSACSGGQGDFRLEYHANPKANYRAGVNSWAMRTTETLPDGNQNVVYTNAFGQVMLDVFRDVATGQEWISYYRYDGDGRLVLEAAPSAVTGYDECFRDLVGADQGNAPYLQDWAGVVTSYRYHSSETGGPEGYRAGWDIRRGEFGTAVPQQATTYVARTAGGITTYRPSADTVYRNDGGSGALSTSYSYEWIPDTHQLSAVTVTLPVVLAGENGPGVATAGTSVLDAWGRPIWSKDPAGFLTYTQYDSATGAVVKVIEDVDVSRTSEFSALPAGWTTPPGGGLHRVTLAEVDAQGRTTKLTDANGNVTYTVYRDAGREIRTYPGWNTATNKPTGPTLVTKVDPSGRFVDSFTMSATPTVSGGRPTGTEAIGSLRTLTRTRMNAAGQTVARDDYFNLSGITYSTALALGTLGTHFYRTTQDYDKQGRPNKSVSPAGTISRTVYDGLGRVLSTWVGTDDTPTTGFWSPDNLAGTDTVQVSGYVYDGGGIGDGNLTSMTLFPGGSEAPRVTETWFDWRNRPVAVKQGVEASEATTVNRPLAYATYDNLGRPVSVSIYDGDGVAPVDADLDGVPDAPAANLLRGKTETAYDALGRVYRTSVFGANQTTGALTTTPLVTDVWYDLRGLTAAVRSPGGRTEKMAYDGLGQPTATYTTDGSGGTAWSQALTVAGDKVLAQAEYAYDKVGNPILVTTRQRFDGETGTGALGTPTTGVKARVSYAASYYDLGDRLTAVVDVGTNNGVAWTRPATVPARSDTVLVTSYLYYSAGFVQDVTDPLARVFRTTYDALGRPLTETFANGTTDAWQTKYGYDSGGRLLSVVEPGNRESRYGYDTFERVSTVTDRYGTALQRSTAIAYNRLGESTSMTDPAGTATTYAYDAVGRNVGTTQAAGTPIARTTSATFDALGRVLSFTDPLGKVTGYAYDDVARTSTLVDAAGHSWVTAYSANGNVVSSTDPYGKSWTASFDGWDRLVSTADPLGNTTSFKYNVTGDRDLVTDPRGNASTTIVDRFGRTSSVANALGNKTSFAYDRADRIVTVTDPRSTQTKYTYDRLDRVLTVTEASGQTEQRVTTFAYTSAGDLSTVTDGRGTVTKYDYDTAGRAVAVTAGFGTASALTTGYAFDDLDRVVRITAPDDRKTDYSYDVLSQLHATTEGVGTPLARTTNYGYDAAGNLVSVSAPLGRNTAYAYDDLNRVTTTTEGVGSSVERSSTVGYDQAGRVASFTDPRGFVTQFGYDAAGRQTTVTDPYGKSTITAYDKAGNVVSIADPLGHADTFTYDNANRLLSVADALGNTTSFLYDANGNRTRSTDPRGYATNFAYDRLDRLTTVTDPNSGVTKYAYDKADNLLSVTNPRSAVTSFAYDPLSRLTQTTDPVGGQQTWTYDAATGDLASVADELGKSTSFGYDTLGRRVTVTSPVNGVTTTAYDAADRITSVTDPVGNVTGLAYDVLDRVTVQTDPRGYETLFAYDKSDKLLSLEDAAGNVTQFAYDKLDRVVSETDTLGEVTGYAYDDAGRLVSISDRLGRTVAYGYDNADRRTSESWYAVGGALVQTQTFGYDKSSNLTSVTDPDGNYAITYDKLNRPVTVSEPFGVSLTFAYDSAGNRTSVTDNKGGTQTSTYDLADRLTSRTLTAGGSTARVDFGYTARHELATEKRYSDAAGTVLVGTTAHTYDDAGRETAIVTTGPTGGTIASYGYTYDLADRLLTKTEDGVVTNFAYDKSGQLVQDGAQTFAYDETGNRTNGTVVGANNRLESDGEWTYTYDAEGNRIGKSKAGESWTYSYDHRGQMTSALKGDGSGSQYFYDAFGNRIRSVSLGAGGTVVGEERYAVDGWDTAKPGAVGTENFDVWADLNASNAVTTRRMTGAGFDDLLARVQGTTVNWYETDRQGSVRGILDNSGSVIASSDFDAFGNLASGTLTDRYGYTGREFDAAVDLYHFRARMYDAGNGLFTGEDPIGFDAGDVNLARYVGNGPTNGTDPSGMFIFVRRSGEKKDCKTPADLFLDWMKQSNARVYRYEGPRRIRGDGYDFFLVHPEDRQQFIDFVKANTPQDYWSSLIEAAFEDKGDKNVVIRDFDLGVNWASNAGGVINEEDTRRARYTMGEMYKSLAADYKQQGYELVYLPPSIHLPGGGPKSYIDYVATVEKALAAKAAAGKIQSSEDEESVRRKAVGAAIAQEGAEEHRRRMKKAAEDAYDQLGELAERWEERHSLIGLKGGRPGSCRTYIPRPRTSPKNTRDGSPSASKLTSEQDGKYREGYERIFPKPATGIAPKTGETASTATGKDIHKSLADARRAAGDFDLVQSAIKDKNGNPILVSKRVDLKTGDPQPGSPAQEAIPDAVSFKWKVIVDDKPMGRPVAKDRQEMIRNIKAFEQREGELPRFIAIQRYDPTTGKPILTELYSPQDFLP